jgi:hypothetical protein
MTPTNYREDRLLKALAWMAAQYLQTQDGSLDNLCMGAGEDAMALLEKYGLIVVTGGGRCGEWTEAGRALLDAR